MKKNLYIGIDIGGTKTGIVLIDGSCNVLQESTISTHPKKGAESAVLRITDKIKQILINQKISATDISKIVICSPGPLDSGKGEILFIASIGWKKVPIVKMVQEILNIPTYLENDANAAAYGERMLGAGAGFQRPYTLIYITVSTGIGCGIIINDEIYRGHHYSSGELGHICIEKNGRLCSCGKKGCLEMYASGTAIGTFAHEQLQKNLGLLNKYFVVGKGMDAKITSEMVAKAAYEGDETALDIFRRMGRSLGEGIAIVMQLFDPDLIVVGGGVSEAWDLFYKEMINEVTEHTYEAFNTDTAIVRAALGKRSGVMGAALLAANGSMSVPDRRII